MVVSSLLLLIISHKSCPFEKKNYKLCRKVYKDMKMIIYEKPNKALILADFQ